MRVLLLNPILYTADNNVIPKVSSIKDCMIYNLGIGFKNLGHEITLVAAEDYKPEVEEVYDIEVIFMKSILKKILLPSVLPLQIGLVRFLNKKKNNYNLIISSEIFSFSSFFSSIISPENTIIWHELALHNRKLRYIPSKIWYNVIVPLVYKKTLVVPRSLEAKQFISSYKKKGILVPVEHGVDIAKFSYSYIKNKQFIVVAQLIERKNISSIIAIFNRFVVKYKATDFKLLIVGQGHLYDNLKEQIKSLELEGQVELCGFKSHKELNKLIAGAMAMLINTKQDNNMVSIPEAIVSGTPVILNTVPTNSNIVRENALGIVKDNWNEDDMFKIVQDNKNYVDHCIKFREKLSTEYCAQSLINLYNENTNC